MSERKGKSCFNMMRSKADVALSSQQIHPPGFRSVSNSPTEATQEFSTGRPFNGTVLYVCS